MFTYPEIQSEIHRKCIIDEMSAIRLEQEASKGNTLFHKKLAQFGSLLISVGEALRRHADSSLDAGVVHLKTVS